MSKIDLLGKLLEAVASENLSAARVAAESIIAAEQAKGHRTAAEFLRGSLNPNGRRARRGSAPGRPEDARDGWLPASQFLSSALTLLSTEVTLSSVELKANARQALAGLIKEWRHADALAARGVERSKTLLMHGPPGCGKSLTALALGNEMGLPTYVVRVDAVVGAFLGQTALRIREIFHFAETTPCVIVLDEIDALGRRRGNQSDVGELDRVVISLMQEIEHTQPRGLVVATSNLPNILDEALLRRFDHVLAFQRSSRADLAKFAEKRAVKAGLIAVEDAIRISRFAKSLADVERQILAAERASILESIGD